MADGPLDRARQDLLDARQAQSLKDTPTNREAVELAMAHLDYLLDTLPLLSPGGSGDQPPEPPVSFPSIPPHEAERLMRDSGTNA